MQGLRGLHHRGYVVLRVRTPPLHHVAGRLLRVGEGKGQWQMTGWVVLFVCIAAAALAVAAWLAGYAVGVADGTRLLIEWCRRHIDWGDGGGDGE